MIFLCESDREIAQIKAWICAKCKIMWRIFLPDVVLLTLSFMIMLVGSGGGSTQFS